MKKNKLFTVGLLLALTVNTASAAVINTPTEKDNGDNVSKTVTITGQIPNFNNGSDVANEITIEILKKDKKLDSIGDYTDNGVVEYADQATVNEDGEYSFTYKKTSDSGSYLIKIGYYTEENGTYEYTYDYVYVSPSDIASLRAAINAAYKSTDSKTELKSVLDDYTNQGIISIDTWNKITDTNSTDYDEKVIDFVTNYLSNQEALAGAFEAAKLGEYINDGYEISKLNSTTKTKNAEDILKDNEYIAKLGVSPDLIIKLNTTGETKKSEIYSKLNSLDLNNVKSTQEAGAIILNTVIFTELDNIMWQEVEGILTHYNEAAKLGLDLTQDGEYKKLALTKQTSAMTKFVSDVKNAKDTSEIKGIFDTAVAYAKNQTSDTGTGSSSSLGSNSRPGSGSNSGSGNTGIITQYPSSNGNTAVNNQTTNVFNDLTNVSWATDAINRLASENIISGDGNGNFSPDRQVKREEFLKMGLNALGLKNVSDDVNFSDVDVNEWYYPYIKGGVYYQFINGKTDGTFGIGESIKRADVAVIITRMLKMYGKAYTQKDIVFKDVLHEEIGYAYDAIYNVAEAKLMTGTTQVTFEPHRGITRAEAAVVIDRLMTLLENN